MKKKPILNLLEYEKLFLCYYYGLPIKSRRKCCGRKKPICSHTIPTKKSNNPMNVCFIGSSSVSYVTQQRSLGGIRDGSSVDAD